MSNKLTLTITHIEPCVQGATKSDRFNTSGSPVTVFSVQFVPYPEDLR